MDRALLKIKREVAIENAMNFRNIRFYKGDGIESPITGSDDPVYGFTCFGLLTEVLRSVGMVAGGTSRLSGIQMYELFQKKMVTGAPKRGDLLFYGTWPAGGELKIGHMAMMIDDYHLIEAGGGGNGIDTDLEAAKENAFVRIRPVESREKERVAICRIWE